jgi:hypothetical protein
MEHRWNEIDRGKPKYSGKNLSTTNPTWTGPGSNPVLRGERPATILTAEGMARPKLRVTNWGDIKTSTGT